MKEENPFVNPSTKGFLIYLGVILESIPGLIEVNNKKEKSISNRCGN